jgi:hypothetical protein
MHSCITHNIHPFTIVPVFRGYRARSLHVIAVDVRINGGNIFLEILLTTELQDSIIIDRF